MNFVPFLWIIFMVFDTGELGESFYCFHCHQTSKECKNGVNLHMVNCSTNKCFILKYETEMPGVKVLATFRGCYVQPEFEIMTSVITEKHAVTEKHFHLCNYTLCNKCVESRLISCSICIFLLVQTFLLLFR
ncbi:unnamed protein product [Psylliodes chrysocephalus]|uniref:Protein quiver n=1 Tax=Psylliodes chrysocephalus TaxID=3402493 RepID=A0A9P0CDI4_9CUCU|nr:unnamed protein product [Psylliodes chrysocephala]